MPSTPVDLSALGPIAPAPASHAIRPWTPSEDARLRELVAHHGTAWRRLSTLMVRSAEALRNRWRDLRERDGNASGRSGGLVRPSACALPSGTNSGYVQCGCWPVSAAPVSVIPPSQDGEEGLVGAEPAASCTSCMERWRVLLQLQQQQFEHFMQRVSQSQQLFHERVLQQHKELTRELTQELGKRRRAAQSPTLGRREQATSSPEVNSEGVRSGDVVSEANVGIDKAQETKECLPTSRDLVESSGVQEHSEEESLWGHHSSQV
ncbi:MAG: hypothetical protein SGPRY_007611 [Prymnesium sp.]